MDELDELYDDHRVLASSMAGFAAAWLTAFTALAEAEKETLGRQVVDRLLGLGKHLNVDFKVSDVLDNADNRCRAMRPKQRRRGTNSPAGSH